MDYQPINLEKTVKKAESFLRNDVKVMLERAGLHRSDLNKPQLIPYKQDESDMNEAQKQINEYYRVLHAVSECLNDCMEDKQHPYRKILKGLYVEGLRSADIQIKIGYSATRYRTLKKQALLEFANRLTYWNQKCFINNDDGKYEKGPWLLVNCKNGEVDDGFHNEQSI